MATERKGGSPSWPEAGQGLKQTRGGGVPTGGRQCTSPARRAMNRILGWLCGSKSTGAPEGDNRGCSVQPWSKFGPSTWRMAKFPNAGTRSKTLGASGRRGSGAVDVTRSRNLNSARREWASPRMNLVHAEALCGPDSIGSHTRAADGLPSSMARIRGHRASVIQMPWKKAGDAAGYIHVEALCDVIRSLIAAVSRGIAEAGFNAASGAGPGTLAGAGPAWLAAMTGGETSS